MTKERFMKIAEEEGITGSDWKERLWENHKVLNKKYPIPEWNEPVMAKWECRFSLENPEIPLRRLDSDEHSETEKGNVK